MTKYMSVMFSKSIIKFLLVILSLIAMIFIAFFSFANPNDVNDFTLIIDEFKVFNDALSSEEIEQLFNNEFRVREVEVSSVQINNTLEQIFIDITIPFIASSIRETEFQVYYNSRLFE